MTAPDAGGAPSDLTAAPAEASPPDLFEQSGQKYNVDPRLVRAVMWTESRGDPDAYNAETGASGAGQFIPSTQRALGVPDVKDYPETVDGVARLLREGYDRYQDPWAAVASYHGGTNTNAWGPKTRDYVQKVAAAYGDGNEQPFDYQTQSAENARLIAEYKRQHPSEAKPPDDLIAPPSDLVQAPGVAPPSDLVAPPSDLVAAPQQPTGILGSIEAWAQRHHAEAAKEWEQQTKEEQESTKAALEPLTQPLDSDDVERLTAQLPEWMRSKYNPIAPTTLARMMNATGAIAQAGWNLTGNTLATYGRALGLSPDTVGRFYRDWQGIFEERMGHAGELHPEGEAAEGEAAKPGEKERVEPPPLRTGPPQDLVAPPSELPPPAAAAPRERTAATPPAKPGAPAVTSVDELERLAAAEPDEGTAEKPVEVKRPEDMAVARQQVEPNPTTAEVESDTAKLGHAEVQGIPFEMETPKGGERYDRKHEEPEWRVPNYPADYGRIPGTKGADGEALDMFVGPNPNAPTAFVVDQRDPETGKFDEHKIMAGFDDEKQAIDTYRAAYTDAKADDRIGSVTPMPIPQLKNWIANGDTKKPLTYEEKPPPPKGPATPQAIIEDIDKGRVGINPQAIAQRYGIEEQQAAQLMHDVYQRPDSPIQPADAKTDDPSTWLWRRVPADRREDRVRDIADWAHQDFGLKREDFASDVEFVDAAMLAENNRVEQRLQPIRDEAAKLGIVLNDQEARDVEYAVQQGADLRDAIHDTAERGAIQHEAGLADVADQQENVPDDFKTAIAPHPELAPPARPEPTRPSAEPTEPVAGTEGGGAEARAEPRGGPPQPEPPAEAVAEPGRPVDSHDNPIFQKGERVVLPEGSDLAGRHGEIVSRHTVTLRPIFGGGPEETSYHYTVRTDEGTETMASHLAPEAERSQTVVPDPVVDGSAMHPKALERNIAFERRAAQNQRARAGQARKPERIRQLQEEARNSEQAATKKQAILDAWRQQYPEEAARVLGEEKPAPRPEVPKPPVAGAEVRENAERNGVEIKFNARPDDATLGKLKAAGFRWSKPQKLWYAKRSPETLEFANSLKGGEEVLPKPAQEPAKTAETQAPVSPTHDPNQAPRWYIETTPEGRRQLAVAAGFSPAEAMRLSRMNWPALTRDPPSVISRLEQQWRRGDIQARQEPSPEPTARVEQQANEQGARAELDHAEHQPAAMPITAAATPEPAIPQAQRFQVGDQVRLAGPFRTFPGADVPRAIVNVSDDGRWITLDGGFEGPPVAFEPLQAEGAAPKSIPEGGNELQRPIPPGAPREGPEALHGAPAERPARPASATEEPRGTRAPGSVAGAGAEGLGRPAEGPAGAASGRGEGHGANARLPRAGEGAEPRAAGRSPDAKVRGQNLSLARGEVGEDRGPIEKARGNLDAIRLANQILKEGRPATREEQIALARYVGWGGLSGAFPDSANKFGKGYEQIGAQLKDLLTPDEYATAARSTQYAHYTSEPVIRAMWDAVRGMGFDGGSVFEPGLGVGHFIGMMPDDLAQRTRYQGIELDHLTARIAKLIYPESGIRQADFTRTPLPENHFDLAIGNPPFSDAVVRADPKYAARGFMLHDYFFAKSLDSVRPGGLLGFVTSAGTMNKLDDAARRYLADRADFVGGVRLPSTAFAKNARTEVTTDILFFRKRMPGEEAPAGAAPWTETVQRELPNSEGTAQSGNVSRYFSEHPEQVLGQEGFFDKLYRNRYAVHARSGEDLEPALRQALDRLPKDVMTEPPSPEEKAMRDLEAPERKDGSFYLKDGQLYQYRQGAGTPVPKRGAGVSGLTALDHERISKLIPIRDALRDVFRHDLAGDGEAAAEARQRLNQHYDAFIKKHGPINKADFQYRRPNVIQQEAARQQAKEDARAAGAPWREGEFDAGPYERRNATMQETARARSEARAKATSAGREFDEGSFDPDDMPDIVIEKRPNIDAFMDDPESYRLRAIEEYNDATGAHRKKRIFNESILTREQEPEPKSANDGVLWSLNKFGRFDPDEIATKMGRDRQAIIQELGDKVYKVPGTRDTYQTADEYLSGDVVDKLAEARAHAADDPEIRRNVSALEAAQPRPLAPSEISMTLGMPWIPSDDIQTFAKDHLRIGEAQTQHHPLLGGWKVEAVREGDGYSQWGIQARSPFRLLEDALNRQSPRIYKEVYVDGEKKREFDPIATQAAQDKVDSMRQAFQDWIDQDPDRRDRLARLYNDKFNRVVLRSYDGSYLTTPGISADWRWRPHQMRGVARVIQSGNTYIAHAVGAGKTSLYIGAGQEMRRLGLVKKPMYVVPNHMLAQFSKEFYEQYPLAKIAIADERRFHTGTRKQFIANVAQDDLDGVVITHSAFGMIPISDEFQAHLIRDELDKISEAMDGLDKKDDRITIKRLENQKEKLEQRLLGAMKSKKDETNTFEEMGVDFLFVDEAHLFRKLQFATRQSGLKGISPEGSQAAWDLRSKIAYLESQTPGRSAVLGSGTPITNTMGELYSLSRYLQPEELERRGIGHFDSWASTFGDVRTSLEQTAEGTYAPVTRFNRFVNIPELYKMVGGIMDVVTPQQLEQYVVRPKLKGGKRIFNLAPKSDALEAYQQELGNRVQAIKMRKGPPKKGDDILLSVINDGRHAAIDMRFVNPFEPSDPDSKLNRMIDNAYRIWKDGKDTQFYDPASNYQKKIGHGPSTQMIFANLGIGEGGRRAFSGYDWIRQELIRRGVPRDEIAFIKDFKSHTARQKLFNDMNEGKVRILIGSTQKMGTGVNAQRRLAALHNQDPLWFPADDEQRVGRILRQGNLNPEIEVHDYSTKGTYDSTMWQMMGNKGRFIEQFFRGDPELRDMDDLGEASQYEQAAAISTSDERIIHLTDLKHQLDKAERRAQAHDREQYGMKQQRVNALSNIKAVDEQIPKIEAWVAQRQDTRGDAFRMKVGDKEYATRKDAANALAAEYEQAFKTTARGGSSKIADIGGFKMMLERGGRDHVDFFLQDAKGQNVAHLGSVEGGGMGLIRSAEDRLRRFEDRIDYLKHNREQEAKTVERLNKEIGKPFTGGPEIARLRQEVRALEEQLNPPKKETPPELKAGEMTPEERQADIEAQIQRNADDYHNRRIDHDTFDREQRRLIAERESIAPAAKTGTERYQMPEGWGSVGPSDMFREHAPELEREVNQLLDRMAPKAERQAHRDWIDVTTPAGERIKVPGVYSRIDRGQGLVHLIRWSLSSPDAIGTARHEAVHYLRHAGLITDGEWKTLTDAAERGNWVTPEIKRQYADFPPETQVEEAIAKKFQGWRRAPYALPPALRRIAERIDRFLRQVAMKAREIMGRDVAANDVFTRIESGEVGRRGDVAQGAKGRPLTDDELDSLLGNNYPKVTAQIAKQKLAQAETTGRESIAPDDRYGNKLWRMRNQGEAANLLERGTEQTEQGEQHVIPGAERETPEQVAARQRQAQKTEAETRMLGRKGGKKAQAPVEETPLFGGKGEQGSLFELATQGEIGPEEPIGPFGGAVAKVRNALAKTLDDLGAAWSNLRMAVAPMAEGSDIARAIAKRFANGMRAGDYEWSRVDQWLNKTFTPEQRRKMWDAADEHSVAIQRGDDTAEIGLNRLAPDERQAVEQMQEYGRRLFAMARKLGMVEGEGLPFYAPRYIVDLSGQLAKRVGSEAPRGRAMMPVGRNLTTTTSRLRQRRYLTARETEEAAQHKFGEGATVVRDIRTLALANRDLQRAIAGRAVINAIKRVGKESGQATVVAGEIPRETDARWFTLADHPAFTTRIPAHFEKMEDGTLEPARDQDGHVITKTVPIYVRGDFEGPLKAVLARDSGAIYKGMMALKGKTMSVIMYSPLIHNAVEWGRALPAMPGKVATFRIYFEGNAAKRGIEYHGFLPHIRDALTGKEAPMLPYSPMREAIQHGLVPIGHWYGFQDISSLLNEPNIAPGRSWTAKLLGAIPGLFDEKAGDAVKRAVDRMGDIWHNTLLWDRVGDLQMGLYTGLRDKFIAGLAERGFTGPEAERAAKVAAAHFANRYAGALPLEAMSSGARKFANFALFSRSFTLGNLGAMKDAITGLPKDAQALIGRDAANLLRSTVRNMTARKALGIIALDIALFHIANAALQSAIAVASGDSSLDDEAQGYARRLGHLFRKAKENPLDLLNPFQDITDLTPQGENEPNAQDRVLVGHAPDGTAIYMRNPTGKIGEEFEGWLTGPLDMIRRKMGTIARPIVQTVTNDDGYGNHVYNPYTNTPSGWVKNIGRIAGLFLGDEVPRQAVKFAQDLYAGRVNRTDMAQTFGPLAGLQFSKGAPGGEAVGQLYRSRDEYEMRVRDNMPAIRNMISDGKLEEARQKMTEIGISPSMQRFYILTTQHPRLRLSPRQLREFQYFGTPEEKERMQRMQEQRQ